MANFFFNNFLQKKIQLICLPINFLKIITFPLISTTNFSIIFAKKGSMRATEHLVPKPIFFNPKNMKISQIVS